MTSYIVTIGRMVQHMKPTDTHRQYGNMSRIMIGFMGWKVLYTIDF